MNKVLAILLPLFWILFWTAIFIDDKQLIYYLKLYLSFCVGASIPYLWDSK